MERKLAHIELIEDIQPIPNADAIVVAQVLGWKCVVKKGEFQIGDKVTYVEVDSILPDQPEFEFLRDRKFRIKTIKLRGQVSQGLVLPLSSLPEKHKGSLKVGTDVTEAMGITKYEAQPEENNETESKPKSAFDKFMRRFWWYRKFFVRKLSGGFPKWIRKTDEERIQNMPYTLQRYSGYPFEATEKLDGQSATYFIRKKGFGYEFGVCSRNLRKTHPDSSSWWKVAKKYDIENVLKKIVGDKEYVVLQGEILGMGIQGNKYGVSELMFYAFNLIYPNRTLSCKEMKNVLGDHSIETVPLLDDNFYLPDTMEEMVSIAEGVSSLRNVRREGIVVRNIVNEVSFKVISPSFLLSNGE